MQLNLLEALGPYFGSEKLLSHIFKCLLNLNLKKKSIFLTQLFI